MADKNVSYPAAGEPNKRISFWRKAFFVLLAIFVAAGAAVLGSVKNTGKAFSYVASEGYVAVYDLHMSSGQSSLAAVYVNVGSIYTKPGETTTITIKRSVSSSSKPSTLVDTAKIGNLYSTKDSGISGANFNWIPVATNKKLTAASISFAATSNLDLNEIVCVGNDGKLIPLSVNHEKSQGFTSDKKQLAYAIDAQDSFSKSSSSYRNFSAEEGYYMTSIHTVLGGGTLVSGSVYNVSKDSNALASVLLLPSVAIFGDSPFALRLTPFIATCAALTFAFLFFSLLFKNEKYGFVAALIFALGGFATTVGMTGAPFAFLVCFLLGSAYFMYRFFSKGISNEKIIKGALNILFSGIFAALAMAINFLSFVPVLGVLAIFCLGLKRMKTAHTVAMAQLCGVLPQSATTGQSAEISPDTQTAENMPKVEGESAEQSPALVAQENLPEPSVPVVSAMTATMTTESKNERAAYAYKKRAAWGFAAISFVLATFVFLLLASVITYSAYVKAFEANPAKPTMGYGALLWKGISSSFVLSDITEYTYANALNVLGWLLPMKAATLYDAIGEAGSSVYLARSVAPNAAVAFVAMVSFAFSTVTVIAEWISPRKNTRLNRRLRRIYFVLLFGAALSMLSCAFLKNVSVEYAFLFYVFYAGFIPLAVMAAQPEQATYGKDGRRKNSPADILLAVIIAIFVLFFAASIPAMYGFAFPTKLAKYFFGWTSIIDNGFFRP